MGGLIVSPPKELGRDPIGAIVRIQQEALELPDDESIRSHYLLVDLAKSWSRQFGPAKDEIIRESVCARLMLERRLGQLLPPAELIRDEVGGKLNGRTPIPEWVSWNLSSAAQLLAKVPKRWFNKVIDGIKDGTRRPNLREIYLEAKRMVAGKNESNIPEGGESDGIITGDFRQVEIQDESVALILTDPPYDRESLELYGDVAEMAEKALLPGGSMVAFAPTYMMREILNSCAEHLRFWWMLYLIHGGQESLMREFGVRVVVKPLVWFTKGGRFNKQQIIKDGIQGEGSEKTDHEWQQGVHEAEVIIDALTAEGDLVLDPMCGSGTTLVAARNCGRRWLGIEVKPETAALARERMESAK